MATGVCANNDCAASGSKLTYGGGPVISSPHVYLIELSSAQTGSTCTTSPTGMVPDAFASSGLNGADAISTMLSSSYSSWWSEYSAGGSNIGPGSFAGCIVLNNASVNGGTVTDSAIQSLLAADHAALPAPSMNNIFVLFFRSNQVVTAGGETSGYNFCAYHNWLNSSVPGVTINYAVLPYEATNVGCAYDHASTSATDPNFSTNAFNNMTPILSHEIAETVTDPNDDAWTDPNAGTVNGWEIGDLCASGGPDYAGPTTSVVSGLTYEFQYLYSNVAQGCINAPPGSAPTLPPTTPTISNLPSSGVVGGGFSAIVSTTGDGSKYLISNSPSVCQVSGLSVSYVGAGTCSLTAAVGVGTAYTSNIGSAQTFSIASPPPPSSLNAGGVLRIGNVLVSPNGAYFSVFQGDGNFVTYTSSGRAVWASGTGGRGGSFIVVQGDGNLVIYTGGGQPLWASNTGGDPVTSLSLDNNGVLWLNGAMGPYWNSASGVLPQPAPPAPPTSASVLSTNGVISEGQSFTSGNGYQAVLQGDGNFVIYNAQGKALWADGVNNFFGPNFIVVQGDGNVVDHLWNGYPLWATHTAGQNTYLVLQGDGNLVLYSGSHPLWATGT